MKIDPEISSLKSLIAVLKSEVSNDHSKIEKLESEIQELKLDHKNVVPNKNDNNFHVSTEDDENNDRNEKSEAIRSSRNKAAIVYKKIDESKKQQQQKEESKSGFGSSSCPARKLFYSNEGDIQMLHAYEIIPFDNKNGGVWYQGFEITYDKEKIKQEEPLEVFVVPHSHNDPGKRFFIWQIATGNNNNKFQN
uniref:Uncharacterized protein n=1 Tax=Panagrolaimus davidi TaxID=227884 RepID=A0A914Q8E2_9BILA